MLSRLHLRHFILLDYKFASTLTHTYSRMVRENVLQDDAHQRSVITQFDTLLDSLSTYQVPPKRRNNTSKLFQLWKQFKVVPHYQLLSLNSSHVCGFTSE
ncbi:hypothetical protein ANCCAN_24368 [Ancylostoma caninum]|uniref:Uncharacterized protein n=1 Tax=Ancylostoma caninum TaxID=29170 RepID=A0A368FI66_ANCCA|nr:hypothetical protein ANCCAN_24368 [Ancylostoma caninum]